MPTLIRPVLALAIVLAAGVPARAQLAATTNTIGVTGEAEIRVVPDEAVLSFGVETFNRDLSVARTENDDRVARAIAAARRQSVASEHIQTDYISISPMYENGNIARGLLGYVVRKTIVVRLRTLDRFDELLTAALQAGVTHVHSVDFQTTKLREQRDRARVLAVQAAREKATLLAREAGRRLGAVTTIGEAAYGYGSSYGSWWNGRYGGVAQNVMQSFGGAPLTSDTALAPGQLSIRVNVHISFALE
jgi:uncharacterized protein